MKGVVFVELLNMAESAVGEEVVDKVISKCPLASGGAYTTVGSYDSAELISLVKGFSSATGNSVEALQRQFGHWMLRRFTETYGQFFEAKTDAFSMLESIDSEVHVEVRKLYPDAELPRFETQRLNDNTLRLVYSSPRRLSAFCHGLIEATLAHYGEQAQIECVDKSTNTTGVAEFTIRRTN
jgi:hypothetical protein